MSEQTGFANGYPVICADIGNGLVKMGGWIRGRRSLVDGKHALVEIDEARYSRLTREHGDSKGHYEYIKWNNRYFVVGQAALVEGNVTPVQGRNKYKRDYFGILFVSTLLKFYQGDVPEVINAFLGYPPNDMDFTPELIKSVVGNWTVDSLGRKKTFRVAYATVFDEVVGGVMNVTLDDDGSPVKANKSSKGPHRLLWDGPTIAADLGYGTFDLVRLDKMGRPDYGNIRSRSLGIGDAIETFVNIFNKRHKKYLMDAENGVPLEKVYDCFYDPKHEFRLVGDKRLDCMDIYKQSTNKLINAVVNAYRDLSRGSISYNYCLLSGGGSGLLYDELCKEVFPQFHEADAIYLAHDREFMHLANVRGSMRMVPAMIEAAQRRARLQKVNNA